VNVAQPKINVAPGVLPDGLLSPPATSPHRLATGFLLIYLFLEMSRTIEVIPALIGVNAHLAIFLIGACALAAVLTGGLFDSLKTPVVLMFTALTCWLMLSTLSSQWRGGSVMTLTIWAVSYASVLVLPPLISDLAQLRKVFYILAFCLVPILLTTVLLQSTQEGRDTTAYGTLANPNDLALHLLLLIPFAAFVMKREALLSWKTIVCSLATLIALIKIFRTGSRAGLLSIVACIAILFVVGKMTTKLKMLGMVGILAGVSFAFVPASTLLRYTTVLNGTTYDEGMSADERSAVESTRARKMLFQESVRLMLEHPVFGVGPGVFSAALAGEQQKLGELQTWHEAHNSYTQLGSESGIPAFALYVGVLLYCFKRTISIYRSTRRDPNRIIIRQMAGTLAMSLLVFAIGATFGTYSYTIHLPVLAGIVQAFDVYVRKEMKTVPATVTSPQPTILATPTLNPRVPNYVRNRRLRDRRV
jgi:O-antigen ligase